MKLNSDIDNCFDYIQKLRATNDRLYKNWI